MDKRKARPGYHKKWREKVKKRYWGRVAAGLCAKCGKTPPDPNRRECASCNARARARERARKKTRKAQGLCVDCGRPSAPGFATCAPCRENKRHYDAKRSGHAVYPATYTVYLRDSDDPLGRFETREDVALFLAFGRLDRDAVEVITDAPPILAYTGCN
ncbi:hypothetical protein [Ruegeria sp.]|uniref:hypothetical protein n=1 Tax=Ruegeria sp. TaxID=1879320 RepID=UPI003AFFE9AF